MRKILSYAGIDENKKIIFYDDVTGMLAARGVWMCLYFSHPDVQMLDGGLSKWTRENLPTVSESTIYKPSNLTTQLNPSIIIGFEELNANIGKVTDYQSKRKYRDLYQRIWNCVGKFHLELILIQG